MAGFQKFDFSQIIKPETCATYETCAGGGDDPQETPIEGKGAVNQWNTDDWRQFYEERAAVLEYDHELPKSEAEARAWEWCIVEWLNRNPGPSEPDRCAWCGKPGDVGAVVPFGVEATWLHHECWEPWHLQRQQEAASAMAEMGIMAPDKTAGKQQ